MLADIDNLVARGVPAHLFNRDVSTWRAPRRSQPGTRRVHVKHGCISAAVETRTPIGDLDDDTICRKCHRYIQYSRLPNDTLGAVLHDTRLIACTYDIINGYGMSGKSLPEQRLAAHRHLATLTDAAVLTSGSAAKDAMRQAAAALIAHDQQLGRRIAKAMTVERWEDLAAEGTIMPDEVDKRGKKQIIFVNRWPVAPQTGRKTAILLGSVQPISHDRSAPGFAVVPALVAGRLVNRYMTKEALVDVATWTEADTTSMLRTAAALCASGMAPRPALQAARDLETAV